MIKRYLVIGIVLLFILMSVNPSFAFDNVKKSSMPISSGNTLYVGGSGPNNYTKIQDAIANATNGDTVFVYNGIYNESLLINKTINLIGENTHNTIVNSISVAVIKIYSDNVNIQGLTITSKNVPLRTYGIQIYSSSCTITCCKLIYNSFVGIGLYDSSNHNTIYKNIFQNNSQGITFNNPHSCSNTIKHNNFISTKPVQDIAFRNNWISNYYDNWIGIGPKIIWGFWYFLWFNIDWRPAKEPYDISRITI